MSRTKFTPRGKPLNPPANSTHIQCTMQKHDPYCQCGCTGFRQTHSAAIVRMLQLYAIAALACFPFDKPERKEEERPQGSCRRKRIGESGVT